MPLTFFNYKEAEKILTSEILIKLCKAGDIETISRLVKLDIVTERKIDLYCIGKCAYTACLQQRYDVLETLKDCIIKDTIYLEYFLYPILGIIEGKIEIGALLPLLQIFKINDSNFIIGKYIDKCDHSIIEGHKIGDRYPPLLHTALNTKRYDVLRIFKSHFSDLKTNLRALNSIAYLLGKLIEESNLEDFIFLKELFDLDESIFSQSAIEPFLSSGPDGTTCTVIGYEESYAKLIDLLLDAGASRLCREEGLEYLLAIKNVFNLTGEWFTKNKCAYDIFRGSLDFNSAQDNRIFEKIKVVMNLFTEADGVHLFNWKKIIEFSHFGPSSIRFNIEDDLHDKIWLKLLKTCKSGNEEHALAHFYDNRSIFRLLCALYCKKSINYAKIQFGLTKETLLKIDKDGETLLTWLCKNINNTWAIFIPKILSFLQNLFGLSYDEVYNTKNARGTSAIMEYYRRPALSYGHIKVQKSSFLDRDERGRTILHYLFQALNFQSCNQWETITYITKNKIVPRDILLIKDNDGQTAIEVINCQIAFLRVEHLFDWDSLTRQ